MVDVPEVVRNKALAAGAAGWLEELPGLIADLEGEWGIEVGSSLPDGTEAFVAEARTSGGAEAVLKLIVPRGGDAARHEITVLRLAGGTACAELFRHDADRGALLMERLGPSMSRLGLPFGERQRILCDLASRLWRPAPGAGLPTGAEKGAWLIDHVERLWEELDRPCSERAVDGAVRAARRRIAAHDDERARLVHGDVHEWNALRAPTGFKLIDPDGLLAEPEYDLGILMREDPLELAALDDPRDRARWLADRTGLSADAIWDWGLVERVSTGLLATRIELQPIGRQMLAVADRVS